MKKKYVHVVCGLWGVPKIVCKTRAKAKRRVGIDRATGKPFAILRLEIV